MGGVNFYIDGSVEGWSAKVLNIPREGKNHDGWLVKNGNVMVSDGSTPLGDDWPQDLKVWVDSVLNFIGDYSKSKTAPLEQAWSSAVKENNKLFNPAGWKRTCYISHVRISNDIIETLTVGDVKLAVNFVDGTVEEVFDGRLDVHEKVQGALIAAGVKTPMEAALTNRAKVNKPEGYYAVADDPAIGSHALAVTYNTSDVDSILIASDGFWRLFGGISEMFDATVSEDLEEIIENINNTGDISDDLTMVRLDRV